MFSDLPTPALLVDLDRLDANIAAMQTACEAGQTQLRPHIKTHKMLPVARRQLKAGAAGLTCAKLGEAEIMVRAFEGHEGPRELFVAHSLADVNHAPRLRALSEQLDELCVACTSAAHAPVLQSIAARAGLKLPVIMALDSGLGREGARGLEGAVHLAKLIEAQSHLELRGLYTHEGHFYGSSFAEADEKLRLWHERLLETREAVEAAVARGLRLWPGCSVSAKRVAGLAGVDAVRPGTYVFGDLGLSRTTGAMTPEQVALQVLATVIDRPADGLALLDCGSKTLSSDRTKAGIYAWCEHGPITKVSEEHGFLTGEGANDLRVGQRLKLVLAHVCPAVNLALEVVAVRGEEVCEHWPVDARGRVQ